MSSNDAVRRRQESKTCIDQQLVLDKGQSPGRLVTPIIKAPEVLPTGEAFDVLGCCKQQLQMMFFMYQEMMLLRRDLELLSDDVVETAIRKLTIPTVDSVPYLIPSGVVNMAPAATAGAFVTISSVLVNEGYDGILQKLGVAAFPSTALDSVTWTLRVSGDAAPKFGALKFTENSLLEMMDFVMYTPPGRTVLLQARNDSLVNIDVAGIIQGFMRPARGIGGA